MQIARIDDEQLQELFRGDRVYELWSNHVHGAGANTVERYGVELPLEAEANDYKHLLLDEVSRENWWPAIACRLKKCA